MRHRSEGSPGSGYVLNPTPECGLPKPEAQSLVVLCLLCSEFVRKLMRVTTPECLFGRARERRSALRRGETIGWVQTMQPISQWPSARTVGAGGSHGGHGEMRGVQRGVGIGPTGIEREDKIGSGIRLGAGAAHGAGVGRRGQHGDRDEQAAGLVMLAEQLARPCRLTCLQSTTSSQSFAIRPAALSSARDRLSRQPPPAAFEPHSLRDRAAGTSRATRAGCPSNQIECGMWEDSKAAKCRPMRQYGRTL